MTSWSRVLAVTRPRAMQVAAVLLLTLVSRASTLFVPLFNSDEAYLAIQGKVLAHGGRLYTDVADRKPPIVPFLYAAVFRITGTTSLLPIHVLAILVVALTALVLAALGRRRTCARSGWSAALVFLLASVSYLPAETMAANFELFMSLPLCIAFLLAGRGRWPLDALGGAALAVAVLCKQTAAVAFLPLAVAVVSERNTRAGIVALVAGAMTTLAMVALTVGPRELYDWSVGGAPAYLSATGSFTYVMTRGVAVTASVLAAEAPLVWLVYRAARPRATDDDRVLWIWLSTGVLAVSAGFRFFGHYYLHLLPPAALLAGRALEALPLRRRAIAITALAVPASLGALAGFGSPRIHRMPDYEPLAAYIRAHTPPGSRIAVWGHYPEAYWASDRMPSSRIVHTGFLTGASGGRPVGATQATVPTYAWDEYFADLAAHPPSLFIDTAPADLRDYAQFPITRYPALAAWVAERYERSDVVDGMVIYTPRAQQATSPQLHRGLRGSVTESMQ